MSVGSLSNNNASVLDLFTVQPAKPEPRIAVERSDSAGPAEREGAFDQALRESSKRTTREAESAEAREVVGRSESESTSEAPQAEQAADERADKPESESGQREPETSEQSAEGSESKAEDQAAETESGEPVLDESVTQAQTQAAQAAAQLSASLNPADDTTAKLLSEAELATKAAKQQAQAATSPAGVGAQALGGAPQSVTQTQAAAVTTVQPIQDQDTPSQSNPGDARGESSSTAKVTTSASTSANNAVASTAFSVPDQPTGEARLPLNTGPNTQSVDATKLVQAQPTAAQSDSDAVNNARLTRGLANAVNQRGGAVTLRLTPPEMGTVRIQMQISGANVSASFHAESASAQTLLTQQLSQLRTSLETQGMNVERLSVQPMASTAQSQNSSQNQNDNQQQNQGQQQSANDGRSRGQFSGDSSGGRSSDGQSDADTPTQQHELPRGFFDELTDAAEPTAA